MKLLHYLPAPLLALLAGLAIIYALGRIDDAQESRFREEEQQDSLVAVLERKVVDARRQQQDRSRAADSARAHEQRVQADQRTVIARQRARQDSLQARVDSILAAMTPAAREPVQALLTSKDSTIAAYGQMTASLRREADSAWVDRDGWRTQSGNEENLAEKWKSRAHGWERTAKQASCPKVLGVVPVPEIGVGYGAVYAGSIQVGPGVSATIPVRCIL